MIRERLGACKTCLASRLLVLLNDGMRRLLACRERGHVLGVFLLRVVVVVVGGSSICSWHQTPAVPHPSYVLAISRAAGAASGLRVTFSPFSGLRAPSRLRCYFQF